MKTPEESNILVVDDEPALREAIIFDLKRKKYNIFEAGNGREAFEIIKKNRIDVVLTDVRMPGGDGVELLEKIKEFSPDLPVVMFITGFSDLSNEEAYSRGVDAIFSKPFDRKKLLMAIEDAIADLDEKWRSPRFDLNHVQKIIRLEFKQSGQIENNQVLNLGRGGMFIAMNDDLPRQGEEVLFDIDLHNDNLKIEGSGIVRWVRTTSEKANQPTGCGIEFMHLSDESRDKIIEWVLRENKKNYIPIGS